MNWIGTLSRKSLQDYMTYIKSFPFIKRDSLNLPKNYLFGCEVEYNKIDRYKAESLVEALNWDIWDEKFGVMQDDNTVDGEIVTRILSDCKEDWDKLDVLLKTLKSNGAVTNKRAAGHIHYNSAMIDTLEKLSNLIKILCVFEPIIYRFGLGSDAVLAQFNYCYGRGKKSLTRVMNPQDVDSFISVLAKGQASASDFCKAYLAFIHYDCYYRPDFNFRSFNIDKFTDQRTLNNACYDGAPRELPLITTPGNNVEVRCFKGSLDIRIWQNNYGMIARIFYAVANDLVDMNYIDRLFKHYRRRRYSFYQEINDGKIKIEDALKDFNLYNAFLKRYVSSDYRLAMRFADIFYNLGIGDEETDKVLFLKQYFKLFNQEDIASLKLK